MPPHCDSVDGPVVNAARQALEMNNVDLVLPYVHADGEVEVREMFARVMPVRAHGSHVREVSDQLFFETVVRIHRAGEHASFEGLKPAGLDVGPVIPLAERAVESGDASEVAAYLARTVTDQLNARMAHLVGLRAARDGSVAKEREFVEAMLGFEVFSHHLYMAMIDSHAGH